MIVFLDSSALIYYFEGNNAYQNAVRNSLGSIKTQHPQAQIAVSRLGVMECLVKPLREADHALVQQYESFFQKVQIAELSASVVTHTTVLRAKLGLKTPDALQAACALGLSTTAVFVTGDAGFSRVAELNLLQVNAEQIDAQRPMQQVFHQDKTT